MEFFEHPDDDGHPPHRRVVLRRPGGSGSKRWRERGVRDGSPVERSTLPLTDAARLLDTVRVPTNGAIAVKSAIVLEAGTAYVLRGSGTTTAATARWESMPHDVAYRFGPYADPPERHSAFAGDLGVRLEDADDDELRWGPYTDTHVYETVHRPRTTGPLQVSFRADDHRLLATPLTVEIFAA